jgi:hypothetical protein
MGSDVRSLGTRCGTGAHLSREVRSGATGHVTAPEPTSAKKQGLEPWNMRQCWSSPYPRSKVRSHWTRDGVGAHFDKIARSGAIGHVTTSESTLVEW